MLLDVELPGNSRVIYELQNSGHTLLLCLITFAFIYAAHRYWFRSSLKLSMLIAVFLSVIFSGLSEYIQPFVGRESSGEDLYQDFLGIIAGVLLYAAFISRSLTRYVCLGCALLVVAYGLSSPVVWYYAKELRDKNFPLLADFENAIGSRFYDARYRALLTFVEAPEGWQDNHSTVARIDFKPGSWPGLRAFDLRGNWGEYQELILEVYNPETSVLELVVRIHDEQHNNEHDDRFNQTLDIAPGLNEIRIPIEKIAKTRSGRYLNLKQIRVMMLYMSRPQQDHTLYFDNFRLE